MSGKNNILLTFDDGFLSSYNFSKKVLDKHNIKSLFFLVSDLLENKNKKKIFKRITGETNKLKSTKFLMEKHIKHLISKGHSIGIHGKSHKDLSKIRSDLKLKKEIIYPIKYFKSKFKIEPKFYAYSYGGINHINKKSIKIIMNNYEYLFTGIRGLNNNFNLKKRFLFRDNIETDADFKTLDFFVNGYADFLYYKSRNKFKNYIFQLDNSLK